MVVVKETRQIFSVADIKAIRLQCKKCQAEVVVSPQVPNVTLQCPQCYQEWRGQTNQMDANGLLLRAIKEIIETPPTLMAVRFEIDGVARESTG